MNRRPLRFVALAYAAVVLWLTVGPAPWQTSGNQADGGILNPDAWTSSTTWTTGYLSEMAFNVVMFLPVGVLAALLIRRRRWPLALFAGLGFTTIIELLQVPEPDRISDPRDLVMNTAGTVLGVLIVLAARMVRRAGAVVAVVAEPAAPADAAAGGAEHAPASDPVERADEPALVGAASGGAAGRAA